MTYDTFVTFGAHLLHSIRKYFMAHTRWMLHGVVWLRLVVFVKAKQNSIYTYFKYILLSADEVVRVSGWGNEWLSLCPLKSVVLKFAALSAFSLCK